MPFDERQIHDITVLDVEGRLTFNAGAELSHRVEALAAVRGTKIVLNLERVAYIDSAGLGHIVAAFMQLRRQDGVLLFVNPSARTRHVLEVTGIATLVRTFASESSAVASLLPAATAQP